MGFVTLRRERQAFGRSGWEERALPLPRPTPSPLPAVPAARGQGKTSRWAVAWSFSADPSVASQPLPRQPVSAGQAAAAAARTGAGAAAGAGGCAGGAVAPTRVGRSASWQVRAPPAAAAQLLESMQRAAAQLGAECSADRATYTLRCSHQPSAEELAAAAEEAAAAAERAPKRQRGAAPRRQQQQQGLGGGGWRCEVRVFMQQKGLFAASATLHSGTPDVALGWFGRVVGALRQAGAGIGTLS